MQQKCLYSTYLASSIVYLGGKIIVDHGIHCFRRLDHGDPGGLLYNIILICSE